MKKRLFFVLFLLGLTSFSLARAQTPATAAVAADVFRLSGEVRLSAPVTRDLLVAGGDIVVSEPVAKDVLAVGGTVVITAPVGGDVRALGGRVVIDSEVAGNVAIAAGEFTLGTNGKILGNAAVWSDSVKLDGTIVGNKAIYEHFTKPEPKFDRVWSFFNLVSLFGALVAGLALVTIFPNSLRGAVQATIANPKPDWLWGVLTFVLAPLALIFLFLTIIGIPLALLLGFGFLAALYLASVTIGLVLGTYLVGAVRGQNKVRETPFLLVMVLGVLAFWLIGGVPTVGPLLRLAGLVWGLGILARLKWRIIKQYESS